MLELFAMKPEDRPAWFERRLLADGRASRLSESDNVRTFKRPDYLEAHDTELAIMLEEWYAEHVHDLYMRTA